MPEATRTPYVGLMVGCQTPAGVIPAVVTVVHTPAIVDLVAFGLQDQDPPVTTVVAASQGSGLGQWRYLIPTA